jgi:tetratricopeptide (TPR) repeat protein
MKIDPSISSTPFANVRNVSYFEGEEEILFSMHSIFQIGQTKQIDGNNRLWEVELALTSNIDQQLQALTERIRQETFPHLKGWHRLVELLIKLAQFDKAQQVCELMLQQRTDDRDEANIYNRLGSIKSGQGKYEEAITFFEKSIEIMKKILSPTHVDVATTYNNIGFVYERMKEYSKALSYHEKAIKIKQKNLSPNHPQLAISYDNMGNVLNQMGEYSKALSFQQKALEISQKTLPPNHPSLAIRYNNIGSVYDSLGDYSKALSFYERALNIGQRSLPENHPHLQQLKRNIEVVKGKM